MRRLAIATALAALAVAPGSLSAQVSEDGYPITVSVVGDARVDRAYLNEVARAIAHRWETPSAQRATYTQWRRVRERTLPEVPRWADDWTPNVVHRASAVLVLKRRGRPTMRIESASDDRTFDRSLMSVVRDPMPASPILPELPAGVEADSLVLQVKFGVEPEGPEQGLIRFAGVQQPAALMPGSLLIDYQQRRSVGVGQRMQSSVAVMEGFNVIYKYDIDANGLVDPRSIQLLEANDRDLARAIQDALVKARFTPATSNGIAVRVTVVQVFGG
jgi:hypothetical protein